MTTKDQRISMMILALVAGGRPLPEAVDEVLGAGVYARLVGDLYASLRAPVTP